MTRGYVCIVEKKKVLKVAYLSSSAYLSHYGYLIIRAIIAGNIDTWIDAENKDNQAFYGDEDPCQGFRLSWIMRSAENVDGDYEEYGYVYNVCSRSLNVYHRGELLFHVTKDEYSKYEYIFKHYYELQDYLDYRPNILAYDRDFRRNKRTLRKLSLTEIKNIPLNNEYIEITDSLLMDCFHRLDRPSYVKCVKNKDSMTIAEFIVSKEYGKWNICFQLPYIRVSVAGGLRSEKACMDKIRKIVSDNYDEFLELILIDAYVLEAFEERILSTDELKNFLRKRWEEKKWYTANGMYTVDKITSEYRFRLSA